MTWQRRNNGIPITLYWPTTVKDRRGNDVEQPLGESVTTECVVRYDRSNRAEVPGFQEVLLLQVVVPANTPGRELWSQAELMGRWWDVYAPAAYRHGTRHVRHDTLWLRRRPDNGTVPSG